MQHLLRGLERHGVGHRAFIEDDFWRICSEEHIDVHWSRKRFSFYFTVPDEDLRVIVLPDRYSGPRLLFAMCHELAHHFLHGGDAPCVAFQGLSDTRYEAEADAVALTWMIPQQVLSVPDDTESHFVRKLWSDRRRLFFLYGI